MNLRHLWKFLVNLLKVEAKLLKKIFLAFQRKLSLGSHKQQKENKCSCLLVEWESVTYAEINFSLI